MAGADAYGRRRGKISAWLADRGLSAALFEDTEGRRDPSVRYLAGQPGDALLVIAASGRSALVPWDVNMARSMASIEEIHPYTDFERSPYKALPAVLELLSVEKGTRIGLPSATPYPVYVDFVERCGDFDFECSDDGQLEFAGKLRSVKDSGELAVYREVSAITDAVSLEIEAAVRSGALRTETDVALFIQRALRDRGCESTGFDTIAAGPSRSFGIHAFPSFTSAPFATEGMSILDFGLVLRGYTSDVTLTFVRGNASGKRAEMIALVEKAYGEAAAMCKPGVRTRTVAARVDAIFSEAGYSMPHGLGHGIGLEAHEAPAVRNRDDNDWTFEPGHVFTIEPGLYDPEMGGVRLENDFLITESGCEALTRSRIVRL